MGNYFVFAGRRSRDMGLIVEHFPNWPKPRKRVETFSIPGRNGLLRREEGAFDNVPLSYDCYFRGDGRQAAKIAQWLLGASGYQRLYDTYQPGFFHMAALNGPMDIENILNRHGRVRLEFDAKPEFFSDAGQTPVDIVVDPAVRTFTMTLVNPYSFPALPLFRIQSNGETARVSVNIGNRAFSLLEVPGYLDVDCAMQNVYKGGENYNNAVVYPTNFPVLQPGENAVSIVGDPVQGVEKLTIWPRWWKI